MSMLKRAAQFSPFAALTGYGDAVEETGRLTSDRITLDEDALSALNEKLQLADRSRSVVAVTHFVDDLRKSGGTYLISSGRIKKIDATSGRLTLEDGTIIAIGDIFDIRIADND
jgi:hypothetical protein